MEELYKKIFSALGSTNEGKRLLQLCYDWRFFNDAWVCNYSLALSIGDMEGLNIACRNHGLWFILWPGECCLEIWFYND